MSSRFQLLAAGVMLLCGCSLSTSDLSPPATNACTSNADCGTTGFCSKVDSSKACLATTAALGQVILEVRPAADAHGSAVPAFTESVTISGAYAKGAIANVDLAVPPTVTFHGEVFAGTAKPSCTGIDGSVPAKVELRSLPTYPSFRTTYTAVAQLVGGNYVYSAQVPAGNYDVYILPSPLPSTPSLMCGDKAVPPRLVSNVDVTHDVNFSSGADAPQRVYGTLLVPKDQSVVGWHVEIVDPKYGLVISDSPPLPDQNGATSLPILGGPAGSDLQGLRYYFTANPIIRVRDQQGQLVVNWTLAGIDTLGTGKVVLNLSDLLANPVLYHGNVIDSNATGVAASVTIQSRFLTGDTKSQASFRVVADSDSTGKFSVKLVPGTYDVLFSPKGDDTLAGISKPLVVDAGSLGFGPAFTLPVRPKLQGNVATAVGAAIDSVPVVATPHAAGATTYFQNLSAPAAILPRDANGTTDANGSFTFPVDPTTVDFSVRPPASSRFSWLVVPNLLVNDSSVAPADDLKTLSFAWPVLVKGTVTSPDGVLSSAVVRAYVPLTSTSVVQIGETQTDAAGHYELPLPPSISSPSPK